MTAVLGFLQRELEALHRVQTPHRVEDYVVSGAALAQLGVEVGRSEEEVFILEKGDELSVGVYLAPRVLEALANAARNVGELLQRGLHSFGVALEGVSHFVYLMNRAGIPRPVSLLELEVQAEVDKFAVASLHLSRAGQRLGVRDLIRRLFDDVTYLPHLDCEQLDRYRTANRLARGYCRALVRLLDAGRIDAVLAELRRTYRLGAGEKLAALQRAGC